MKLLDTSVAVDHLRGVTSAVELLTRQVEEGQTLVASELIRFELLAGVRPSEIDALEHFFSSLLWLTVDEDITRAAGSLARKHRKAHSGIDDVDYLIAATAIVADADLLTTNVRHFPMFEGLGAPY
ncbi:MAG: type II toxin-antitoxin system VapC family toxin [Solirubrobacteraceae bacterium]